MKKLSFLLAMVFAVTFAMAQNTSTVNQSGTSNSAATTQTGDLNTATVDQAGTLNFVTVTSTGDNNLATGVQNGTQNGDASRPDLGYIKQIGNSNIAHLNEGVIGGATSNYADGFIDQTGDGNYAELNITGQYHNGIDHGITQIQLGVEMPGNQAFITEAYFNNDMDVYQRGSDNLVTGIINGENNQFFVDQDGTNNTAWVNQLGDSNGEWGYYWGWHLSDRNWNVLSQNGTENTGKVDQQGDFNKFKMVQEGDYNVAQVLQLGASVLDAYQFGAGNLIAGIAACVIQDWATLNYGASLTVDQIGDNNKLYVNLNGSMTVTQTSSTEAFGNIIKYEQTGAGATATMSQTGDENVVSLLHGGSGDADIYQNGTGNMVGSIDLSSGEFNDPCCGHFNGATLDVDQVGSYNLLHLDSNGLSDVVTVNQNGTSNLASVIQN